MGEKFPARHPKNIKKSSAPAQQEPLNVASTTLGTRLV
jgi:hypothetical protein